MGIKDILAKSPLADYGSTFRSAPRKLICNRQLILTALLYSSTAIPLTWDQGSNAVIPSLKGFQRHFNIDEGTDAGAIKNFVSLAFAGQAVGAALSFFLNDRLGRLWSLRLYNLIYIIGQIITLAAPDRGTLYAGRIVAGLGIGGLTVTGPISLAEIAPAEIRGVLIAWFPVMMGLAHVTATFCVYGVHLHIPTSNLQYQIPMFAPCLYVTLWMMASPWLCESPRWLSLVGKHEKATDSLLRLRGLPFEHPRVQTEMQAIEFTVRDERAAHGDGMIGIVKETFTKPSNLRRVSQALICYALPQLSGASTISSYFVPILRLLGQAGDDTHNIFLTGMWTMARFFYATITAFFLIDALGRRKSLFLGTTLQMLGDVYVAVYLKVRLSHDVSTGASQGALAMMFIHSFGYSAGLLTLPYVFGGELWPNRIRSFGAALSQAFHWAFSYAMAYGLPSLLDETSNWGAFVFFACWCCLAFLYVMFFVPELAGLSLEEIESVFSGSWFNAYRTSRKARPSADAEERSIDDGDSVAKDKPVEETVRSEYS